jgi:hypothetical protein
MRRTTVLLAIVVLCGSSVAQEKKSKSLQLKDLPAGVQKTVQDDLKGGQIKNIGKEKEDGIEQYEVESLLNGKSRDFNVDTNATSWWWKKEPLLTPFQPRLKLRS